MRKSQDPRAKGASTNIHNDHKWSGRGSCINIDHSLYKRNAYYRLLIRAQLVSDLLQTGHFDIDFVCGKNCCCDIEEAEAELIHQIWLDLPVGSPSIKRDAA